MTIASLYCQENLATPQGLDPPLLLWRWFVWDTKRRQPSIPLCARPGPRLHGGAETCGAVQFDGAAHDQYVVLLCSTARLAAGITTVGLGVWPCRYKIGPR